MTEVMAAKPATTRIPRQLRESDVHGKGAAEIGWGTPGDFDRCRAFMRRHAVPGHEIDGACANLHRIATGEWPGPNAHKGHLASVAVISLVAAAGPDTGQMIRWHGPLAVVGEPTGDRRRFPHDTLKYQSFPQPLRFQRQGLPGHQGAVTVGVIEDAKEQTYTGSQKELQGKRVVYGHGYFLDPDIIAEVNEAIHLAENGVSGPSVDLDSYTAVLKKNAMSGETTADMVRGRQRAATLVSVPAFADLRIEVVRPKEQTPTSDGSGDPDTAIVASSATFAVNSTGWHSAPIAPREALFDADDAAKRIEGWANGDPKKMASMFLWIADSANAPLIGRKGYRLPWGDIVDGKPYLIFHAVYAAAALLEGAHGGLPNIPDEEKAKLRTVISSIYEDLAAEYNDPSIMAPWDRQAQQQAAGGLAWNDADATDVDEYAYYVSCYTAALEEFVRHHRYTERKHPRDPRKDDHAGEWIDTPHGPHGQIKVGGKWVYPPKRDEKGYKSPEKSARGIAKRGGGKATTHVAHKAQPKPERKHAPAPAARKAAPKAPEKKAPAAPQIDRGNARRHLGTMQHQTRLERSDYLGKLRDDEVENLVHYLGGTRHSDDSRSDLETEVLHQMERDQPGKDLAKERQKDVERAKGSREIDHGGASKTVIAKKETLKETPKKEAPKEQKTSLTERVTLRQVRDAGDEGALKSKLALGAKEQVDGLVERGLLEKRGRARYHITDKGHEALKGHDSEEPEKKTDLQKELEKPRTRVVRKKTGQVKEHKLTDSQERGLKSVNEGGKAHPASKKVLQREGYLDDNGDLTQKGKDHLGVKEIPKKEEAPVKEVSKTTVAKKEAPQQSLTPAQQRNLEEVHRRVEAGGTVEAGTMAHARKGGVGLNTAVLKRLEDAGLLERRDRKEGQAVGGNYYLTDKGRKHLGVGAETSKKEESGSKTTAVKEIPKLTAKEKLDAKKKENLDLLYSATDENLVVERLKNMSRSELIAAYGDRKLNPLSGGHDSKWSDDELREQVLQLWRFKQEETARREKLRLHKEAAAQRKVKLADYGQRVEAADAAHRKAVLLHRTENPLVVTGSTYGSAWTNRIPEDTGPLGIPVDNLSLDADGPGGGYLIKSGRAIRRNGIVYVIEDGPGTMADEMADFLEATHRDLPGGDRIMKGYVWAHGNSPDDAYWQKRFGNPGHYAAASSGDGIMRFWGPGNKEGLDVQRQRAKHEYGHNLDYLLARKEGGGSDSHRWQRHATQDAKVGFPIGWQWNGRRKEVDKSVGSSSREVPLGVTDYGKSSWMEDFAESADMYLRGSIGSAQQGMLRVPVYFRDLFPGRASELDELFPDIAKRQREEISRRGPLTFL